MIDIRYPWMVSIEDAPIDPALRGRIRRSVAEMNRRTGVKACYNKRTQGVFLYYGDSPDHGPGELPTEGPKRFSFDGGDTDLIVSALQTGHHSRREKDRAMARREAAEKYETAVSREKFLEDNRPGVREKADFLWRKRRGLQKVTA